MTTETGKVSEHKPLQEKERLEYFVDDDGKLVYIRVPPPVNKRDDGLTKEFRKLKRRFYRACAKIGLHPNDVWHGNIGMATLTKDQFDRIKHHFVFKKMSTKKWLAGE